MNRSVVCRIRAVVAVLMTLAAYASAGAADYYVDVNYAGVDGAPFNGYAGAYKSIVAALSNSSAVAVPSGSSALSPNRIYFAPGTYNTAFDTGVSLVNSKSNIALLGMTGNPDDVVITSTLDAAYNPGSGALGTTGSSTLQLRGSNTTAKGITFANSTDTPYIVNVTHQTVSPQGNYMTGQTQTSNSQAVALKLQGDQQAFVNCKFLGYQDTLYVDGGRAYFENVLVNGDIDFIFSKGTAVFKNSTINLGGDHNGGTITAASTDKRTSNGIVFLDSEITGNSVRGNPVIDPFNAANVNGPANNNMWLGRPWGWQQAGGDASTVFINTKMDDSVRAAGWLNWNANELNAANGKNDGDPKRDTRYAEFNSMDSSGSPLDVSGRVAWSRQLTADQAADYTVENIFSPEANFAWFGSGYAGSADPSDPNYSWPAFWGNRNSNNDTSNATVSAVYPLPGNPSAYSNPQWAVTGAWNPTNQIMAAMAPEPSTCIMLWTGSLIGLVTRPRAGRQSGESRQILCVRAPHRVQPRENP
ncbi:MAG: pectinesterase family protein [Pirellulales bacterium]